MPMSRLNTMVVVIILLILMSPSIFINHSDHRVISMASFSKTRDDDSIAVPQWRSGNKWVYQFNLQGTMSGMNSVTVTGTITYTVVGEETITLASGVSVDCYKVDYNRQYSLSGTARSTVNMQGTTTGTEWYAKESLELVKAEYNTDASGYGSEGGFSVNIHITDTTTMDTQTQGDFWSFPVMPIENWTTQSVRKYHSDTYVDYTPDGGFYPDDSHDISDTTFTDSYTISSEGREAKTCQAGTFQSIKVHALDSWSKSNGESGNGEIIKWLSRDVGNFVYAQLSNVYDLSVKVQSGWYDLVSYSYTYVPPPEYGVSAHADKTKKSGRPGDTVEFTITVANVGGYDDTIECEVLPGGSGWGSLDKTTLQLQKSQVAQVVFTVQIPQDAQPGSYGDQLKFTSQGDPTKYALLTLTTEVVENMPPVIKSRQPGETRVEVIVNDTVTFSITASDPDGDDITITWYLDNTTMGNSNSITFKATEVGNHTVRVVVSDGESITEFNWTLVVLPEGANRAPRPVWWTPREAYLVFLDIDNPEFGIAIEDPDGDMVALDYYLDGEIIRSVPRSLIINDTFTLHLTPEMAHKNHTLVARFYDDRHESFLKWEFYVKSSSEITFPVLNRSPDGLLVERGAVVTFWFRTNYTYDFDTQWFVDWVPIQPFNRTVAEVDTSELDPGEHTVAVSIYPSVGEFLMLQWNLTVVEELHPKIIPVPAKKEVYTNLMETVRLEVKTTHPDYVFRWFVDGIEDLRYKSTYIVVSFDTPGEHNVTVNITNSYGYGSEYTWIVHVSNKRNLPPEIVSYTPIRNVRIYSGEEVKFSVDVEDNDDIADSVVIIWYVNDAEMERGSEYTFSIVTPGTYEVKVVATDGKFYTSHNWTVQVNENPMEVQTEKKDNMLYRYLLWATGGVVFMLLVGIVSLAFKPPAKKKKRKHSLHCPRCMGYIEEDWKYCPSCGAPLDLRCEGCGAKILPEWKYCPVCHKRLSPEERGLSAEEVQAEMQEKEPIRKRPTKSRTIGRARTKRGGSEKRRKRVGIHEMKKSPAPRGPPPEDEEFEGVEW